MYLGAAFLFNKLSLEVMIMSKRPGVMIYFDILQVLERISDQDAGRLFRAILEYGRDGKIPALPDSACSRT